MNRKHFAFLLVTLMVLMAASSAFASGAPTSQFGFSGWPYRQSTNCGSTQGTCDTNTNQGTCGDTQGNCATNAPVCAPSKAPACEPPCTPEPTQAPTVTPAPCTEEPCVTEVPTVAPTLAPTTAPTVPPTAKPNATATAKPTAVPTAKPTATPTVPSSDDDYTTDSITAQEQTAINLMNQDRLNNGLSALTVDPALCALARLKSCDMNANNYFAHQSPSLGSAAEMLRAHGYSFSGVGENIAHHATVEKSQAAFMSSDGHRRNILGSQWTKVGIGVCYDKNGFVYVTQLFVR